MISKAYKFGKTKVMLNSPEFTESDILKSFSVINEEAADAVICITVSDELDLPAGPGEINGDTVKYLHNGEKILVVRDVKENRMLWKSTHYGENITQCVLTSNCAGTLNTHEVMRIMALPDILVKNSAAVLHASFVDRANGALLFTAPKQTGKSTQAALWQKFAGAEVINGDRALVEKRGERWFAAGVPFCGTSGICKNKALPLTAIIILAQGKANRVRAATEREKLFYLLSGITFDREDEKLLDAALSLIDKIAVEVPVLFFECLPDESAVKCLDDYLTEMVKQ